MISRITAIMMASNDSRPAAFPDKGGKYRGEVHLYQEGAYHTLLVSSGPDYDSSDAALKDMQDLIDDVRKRCEEQGWLKNF